MEDNLTPDERAFLDALRLFFEQSRKDAIEDAAQKGAIAVGSGHWTLGNDSVKAAKQAIEAPQN